MARLHCAALKIRTVTVHSGYIAMRIPLASGAVQDYVTNNQYVMTGNPTADADGLATTMNAATTKLTAYPVAAVAVGDTLYVTFALADGTAVSTTLAPYMEIQQQNLVDTALTPPVEADDVVMFMIPQEPPYSAAEKRQQFMASAVKLALKMLRRMHLAG